MKIKLNFSKDLNNCVPMTPPSLISCYGKHPRKKSNQDAELWGSGKLKIRITICIDNIIII